MQNDCSGSVILSIHLVMADRKHLLYSPNRFNFGHDYQVAPHPKFFQMMNQENILILFSSKYILNFGVIWGGGGRWKSVHGLFHI